MAYPKRQWLLAVKRGRKTSYYYGDKLGALVAERVKANEAFEVARLERGPWAKGVRMEDGNYVTKRPVVVR